MLKMAAMTSNSDVNSCCLFCCKASALPHQCLGMCLSYSSKRKAQCMGGFGKYAGAIIFYKSGTKLIFLSDRFFHVPL